MLRKAENMIMINLGDSEDLGKKNPGPSTTTTKKLNY